MKHLDLCSGIGGFALAASWVWPDHEILSFVEIDEYCQQVLRKHWPDVPIHDDCKTFDARPFLGRVDILTGGYPCQPFSMAGKRQGEEDDRHLWPEVFRIARECRPRWCLFENVAGHVTLGLDSVLADLEGIGYTCAATVIPACAVDAPHRRDRLWIVANSGGGRCGGSKEGKVQFARRAEAFRRGEAVADAEGPCGQQSSHEADAGTDCGEGGNGSVCCSEAVGHSAGERLHATSFSGVCRGEEGAGPRHEESERRSDFVGNPHVAPENAHPEAGGPRRATGEPGRGLAEPFVGVPAHGLPEELGGDWRWVAPRGMDQYEWEPPRMAMGVPMRREKLTALGNAIVPQVAAEIMRAIPADYS